MRPQTTALWSRAFAKALTHARAPILAGVVTLSFSTVSGLSATATTNTTTAAPVIAPPSKPREFFNAGTRELSAGKLREAEAYFETALASQSERLQTPALYNLGHVRFDQGIEEFKKGPPARSVTTLAQVAEQQGQEALQAADAALESNDVQKMVAAYLQGRGKRRELKAAQEAVLKALKAHGATLAKWERASGDFKSAFELDSTQADARHNADVVDRRIAQLVDSLCQLKQQCTSCSGMCNKLGDKLKQLKGRIPGSQMPQGAGDDEDDEDQPLGPQPGQKEVASKQGNEMTLSPEQAGWLLEGYRLDSERRLPMVQSNTAEPKDRSRKTW